MIWLVSSYLVVIVTALTAGLVALAINGLVPQLRAAEPLLTCALVGGIGGCLYCLRAVYLNACVHRRWSQHWLPWYFIRPLTSLISGGASYIFLYAGLLVLDSEPNRDTTMFGFYALAFVAGLNVDRFLAKIEDIALTTWGIDKSRVAKEGNQRQEGG